MQNRKFTARVSPIVSTRATPGLPLPAVSRNSLLGQWHLLRAVHDSRLLRQRRLRQGHMQLTLRGQLRHELLLLALKLGFKRKIKKSRHKS